MTTKISKGCDMQMDIMNGKSSKMACLLSRGHVSLLMCNNTKYITFLHTGQWQWAAWACCWVLLVHSVMEN